MALRNILLLSQIAGYVIALILSLCIIVPLGMHRDEFSGHCLLFSKGTWQEEDGQLLVSWASQAYCNYITVVGFMMGLFSCIQIYRMSMLTYRGIDTTFLAAFVESVGCVTLCTLSISAAIILTLGFMTWCKNIEQRFPSCEDVTGQDIDKKDNISTHGFYVEFGCAQFGLWGAFATWVGLAVFSTLKVCRYHQLQNIQVTMFRERQRLVNDSGSPAPGRSTPPRVSLGE